MAQLTRKTALASVWLIGSRLGTRAIDFASLLILARVLSPADFGVVAIAMTLVQIVEVVFDMPIGQVLVRSETLRPGLLDTAFTIGLLRGLFLAAVLAGLSWPVALSYGDSRLIPLICFLSLAPAFRGISSPRMALYAKSIDFRRDVAVELTGKGIALLVAAVCVVVTRSYWAIAAYTVAGPIVMAPLSYILAPHRLRVSVAEWPEFSNIIGWSTAAQLVAAINWQGSRLALGAFAPRAELGAFSLATEFAGIPEQAIIKPVNRSLMASFAQIRGEPARLAKAYGRSVQMVITLGVPVMLCMAFLGAPAIRLLLGAKWQPAAPMVQWIALSYIIAFLATPFQPLLLALGRTEYIFRQSMFELAFRLPTTLLGAWLAGATGVIAAQALGFVFEVLNITMIVRRVAGVPVRTQLAVTRRPLAAGVPCMAFLLLARPILSDWSGATLFLALAATAVAAAAIYVAALFLLWLAAHHRTHRGAGPSQLARLFREAVLIGR